MKGSYNRIKVTMNTPTRGLSGYFKWILLLVVFRTHLCISCCLRVVMVGNEEQEKVLADI